MNNEQPKDFGAGTKSCGAGTSVNKIVLKEQSGF